MVDWQSPITIQNELGASILNVFEVFFPRLIASNFSFSVTGRRLCQNRTCHRRNLYVRFSPPLFVSSDPTAIARKAHVLSMLAGSSFAISALSTICFAGAVFGGGLLP